MPRTLKACLRAVAAILVIGLFARAGKAEAAEAPTGMSSAEAFALMFADQTGECSTEDHENPLELCGVELWGDFVDDALLLMPRDTCSVLLEELFKDQVCAPGDAQCQQQASGVVPVPGSKLASSGNGQSVSGLFEDPRDDLAAAMARWRRAVSDEIPEGRVSAPPVPPPELRA